MEPIEQQEAEFPFGTSEDASPDEFRVKYTFDPKAADPRYLAILQSYDKESRDDLVAVEFGAAGRGQRLSATAAGGRRSRFQYETITGTAVVTAGIDTADL